MAQKRIFLGKLRVGWFGSILNEVPQPRIKFFGRLAENLKEILERKEGASRRFRKNVTVGQSGFSRFRVK